MNRSFFHISRHPKLLLLTLKTLNTLLKHLFHTFYYYMDYLLSFHTPKADNAIAHLFDDSFIYNTVCDAENSNLISFLLFCGYIF